MAMNPSALSTAIKNAIQSASEAHPNITTSEATEEDAIAYRNDMFLNMATAIIDFIKENMEISCMVTGTVTTPTGAGTINPDAIGTVGPGVGEIT